jgi:hypothetical protein
MLICSSVTQLNYLRQGINSMTQTPEDGRIDQLRQDHAPIGAVALNAADVDNGAPLDGPVSDPINSDGYAVTGNEEPTAAAEIVGTPEWIAAHTKTVVGPDGMESRYFDLAPQFQGLSPEEIAEELYRNRQLRSTGEGLFDNL